MTLKYATNAEAEVDVWKIKTHTRIKNLTQKERIDHYAKIDEYLKMHGMGHLLVGDSLLRGAQKIPSTGSV
ncbi:hypothetical protein FACS189483_03480 [Spirochaetia bacterium]|nr:hypothetical protein FACS189483_03480 [Spirochaetia bacterium]